MGREKETHLTNGQLAAHLHRILTDPNAAEIDTQEGFEEFMTDLAYVLCGHCGGRVSKRATYAPVNGDVSWANSWQVGIYLEG